jgi:predicted HicB family RNase H-like nuclease
MSAKPSEDPINPSHYKGDLVMRIIEKFRLGFHMAEFLAAAARAGISLSAWVTERLLRCARQESRQEKQESRHD